MRERSWLLPIRQPRASWVALGALIAALGYAACEDPEDNGDDPGSAQGNFGPGSFTYRCVNDNDPACTNGGVTFPNALAVGSRFDLSYANDKEPTPQIVSPALDFVKRSEGSFQVLQAGEFAILALNGSGEVQNAIHLRAADIAEVRVQKKDSLPLAKLTLDPGEAAVITAAPFDHNGTPLGGALSYDWRSADTSIVSFQSLTTLDRVSVLGGDVGRSEVVVQVAGQDFHVAVEVGDVPDAGPAVLDAGLVLDAGDPVDAQADAHIDAALEVTP